MALPTAVPGLRHPARPGSMASASSPHPRRSPLDGITTMGTRTALRTRGPFRRPGSWGSAGWGPAMCSCSMQQPTAAPGWPHRWAVSMVLAWSLFFPLACPATPPAEPRTGLGQRLRALADPLVVVAHHAEQPDKVLARAVTVVAARPPDQSRSAADGVLDPADQQVEVGRRGLGRNVVRVRGGLRLPGLVQAVGSTAPCPGRPARRDRPAQSPSNER